MATGTFQCPTCHRKITYDTSKPNPADQRGHAEWCRRLQAPPAK
jgi:hypothetical protein